MRMLCQGGASCLNVWGIKPDHLWLCTVKVGATDQVSGLSGAQITSCMQAACHKCSLPCRAACKECRRRLQRKEGHLQSTPLALHAKVQPCTASAALLTVSFCCAGPESAQII